MTKLSNITAQFWHTTKNLRSGLEIGLGSKRNSGHIKNFCNSTLDRKGLQIRAWIRKLWLLPLYLDPRWKFQLESRICKKSSANLSFIQKWCSVTFSRPAISHSPPRSLHILTAPHTLKSHPCQMKCQMIKISK